MHHRESLLASVMNYMVSGYVYFVAFTLVLYMVSTLVTGVLGVATSLLDLSLTAKSLLTSPERSSLELELLHTIAFTIVLVKAYKILIAYAETRHINLKFLVEIAIIAPTIELLFNPKHYSFEVMILMAAFAFCNLVAYLFFYPTLKIVSRDYVHENMCDDTEHEHGSASVLAPASSKPKKLAQKKIRPTKEG
jgi:uncharacterized membrane protein (DUF373 family)